MVVYPDWAALAPALALAVTGLVLLLIDSVDPDDSRPGLLAGTAVVGTLVSLGYAGWFLASGTGQVDGGTGAISLYRDALVVDGMALFFQAVFAVVTALVCIASYDYLKERAYQAEFYSLVMFAATGMAVMATANSLATAFIALELASLPSYALVAFLKHNRGSVEASLKYFLIGALSSAVFAFGISLVYAATGSLLLADVASALSALDGGLTGVAAIGVLMVAGGFAFKTASVPFHFWAPEAYEGAPAPISAFLSSASKAAGFAVLFRVFTTAFPLDAAGVDWMLLFQVLAVVTMTLGNFAAATQETVKRMLAYSSIGHAGYALIGLAAWSGGAPGSVENGAVLGASMAHLLVYGFMNTGAFLFVALAEQWDVGRTFEDYAGLGSRAPMASVAMTVFMFSLAGVPPFGGFFSKLFLFAGAVDAGFWWLAAVGVVNSTLSLYYYSRVVKALWVDDPVGEFELGGTPTGLYVAVVFAAVGTLLLLPGFAPVIETAQSVAAALVP
ncbi:NADH-quinone oxidoreductase subunit N [Candidatus Halobonum tyrrellensis]|uniref:NADH dehydrogenase, subunit N (Ubiquinone) n=1 Tax=Candidatus Halobonum tyrrellensis G22 TaxID=1324957 RepID=V4HEJ7_9EURY|nr:NADH-quinone oxidoreductase subunit N [Candidatus Halobonum tyrrellensis]ESP88518.1 NADH dehydrogenase, subunit N (ubiquinone) [Candidatus Halobonum tyrrellensis G22]